MLPCYPAIIQPLFSSKLDHESLPKIFRPHLHHLPVRLLRISKFNMQVSKRRHPSVSHFYAIRLLSLLNGNTPTLQLWLGRCITCCANTPKTVKETNSHLQRVVMCEINQNNQYSLSLCQALSNSTVKVEYVWPPSVNFTY